MGKASLFPIVAVLACGLAAEEPKSAAGFALNGSATFGSQYIWRGLTQTDGRPTVQGGLDLSHSTGFYLSAGLSNISWYTDQNAGFASDPTALGSPGRVGAPLYTPNGVNSATVELDLSGGYRWGFAKDWSLDIGLYRYLYPGTYDNVGAFRTPHTSEAYLGFSWSWVSLKYSHGLSASYMGVANAQGTSYVDLSFAIPVGGWTILLHGGKTTYSANANRDYFFNGTRLTGDNSLFSYTDYKLGVSKEFKGYTFSLFATDARTRARASDNDVTLYENAMGRNIGGNRVTLTIGRGF